MYINLSGELKKIRKYNIWCESGLRFLEHCLNNNVCMKLICSHSKIISTEITAIHLSEPLPSDTRPSELQISSEVIQLISRSSFPQYWCKLRNNLSWDSFKTLTLQSFWQQWNFKYQYWKKSAFHQDFCYSNLNEFPLPVPHKSVYLVQLTPLAAILNNPVVWLILLSD